MDAKELFGHGIILGAYRVSSVSLHFLTRYDFDVSLRGEAHEWNQQRGNYCMRKVVQSKLVCKIRCHASRNSLCDN